MVVSRLLDPGYTDLFLVSLIAKNYSLIESWHMRTIQCLPSLSKYTGTEIDRLANEITLMENAIRSFFNLKHYNV